MMASFTAGISVLVLVVAGAIKLVRAGNTAGAIGLRDEVEQLRAEVERLRGEVEGAVRHPEIDEIQNRLDFAERVLAQMKARDALPGPS
jgi:hypothetical protein